MKYLLCSLATILLISNFGTHAQAFDLFGLLKEDVSVQQNQDTELQEIEMLTGEMPMGVRQPQSNNQNITEPINATAEMAPKEFSLDEPSSLKAEDIIWADAVGNSVITNIVIPVPKPGKAGPDLQKIMAGKPGTQSPDLDLFVRDKPMNVDVSDVIWAVAPAVDPVAKPAPEDFAETAIQYRTQQTSFAQETYDLSDPTASMAMQVQGATETSLPLPAPSIAASVQAQPRSQFRSVDPVQQPQVPQVKESVQTVPPGQNALVEIEPVDVVDPVTPDQAPLFTLDDIKAAEIPHPIKTKEELNIQPIKACPTLTLIPEARSITYFAEDGSAIITARAAIDEVRGGCEAVRGGIEIDLDIVMKGRITNKGRFNGDRNLESFVTFPYFVTVISPEDGIEDKKILATAMRFPPVNNHVVHAEKITQFIPLTDMARAHEYQLGVGFQLTRKQLAYNRAQTTLKATNNRASPDVAPAQRRSYNPLKENGF